jgi:hypothetical protein
MNGKDILDSALKNLQEKFEGCPEEINQKVNELCEKTRDEIRVLKNRFSPKK